MATSQSTPIPAPDTDARLNTIREQFCVKGRLAVHPTHTFAAVSDCGRVFSWRVTTRYREGQLRELKQSRVSNNRIVGVYWCVYLLRGSTLVHRLVAETFLPAPADGQDMVRHLDGNPSNNCADNLAWGMQQQNMEDMIRHGRSQKGERSAQAKLTANRVRIIRDLLAEEFKPDVVAHLFNTSEANVNRIGNGEAWSEGAA